MGALKLVTAPASNPVTLAEAKLFLRVDHTADDSLINALIPTATAVVENYTNRKLISQTWDYFLDSFPMSKNQPWWEGVREGKLSELISVARFINIPLTPVSAVSYLKTFDDSDAEYTMDAASYQVDTASEPARLALRMNSVWPTTVLRPVNGIAIRCVVGYASASAVPAPLKQALLDVLTQMYQCRGEYDGQISKIAMSLMTPYRTVRL